MYDSFLYGYGLTLAVFAQTQEIPFDRPVHAIKYLDFNAFFNEFIQANDRDKILVDFYKYFEIHPETKKAHDAARLFLSKHRDEINLIGFERWISQHIFEKNNTTLDNVKVYTYLLYNYWYHILYIQLLNKKYSKKVLRKFSREVLKKVRSRENIYTTNFETLLDQYLFPKHIHGTFSLPLGSVGDIILWLDRKKNEFEYSYLFGTNGIEKGIRLHQIHQLSQDKYHLDFFFEDKLDLGHLLIYGLSFSPNKVMPDNYLEEAPQHKDFYFLRSVDGHIQKRLEALYINQRVKKITISYYTEKEREYLAEVIRATPFKDIVEYKHSSEIFKI
ncbi:MAG: hypothetical protein HN855_11035 [Anaerolineae bacterium]|jgi:hypothetical protein|nr:hypothetical protein [Anaerolineae bacterium]MBT7325686.1 hypothetical protein [Anaerolineae bacterium]